MPSKLIGARNANIPGTHVSVVWPGKELNVLATSRWPWRHYTVPLPSRLLAQAVSLAALTIGQGLVSIPLASLAHAIELPVPFTAQLRHRADAGRALIF